MVGNNIRDIVSQVLNSPELKSTLETTVYNLTGFSSSSVATVETTSTMNSASRNVRQEIARLFPTVRQHQSRRKKAKIESEYHRDCILVKSPNWYSTLKGARKSLAFETGKYESDNYKTYLKITVIIIPIDEVLISTVYNFLHCHQNVKLRSKLP